MCINCNDPLQINLVSGPPGAQGPQGIPGAAGANGSQGPQGIQGVYGGVVFPFTFEGFNIPSTTPSAGAVNFTNSNASTSGTMRISVVPAGYSGTTSLAGLFNTLSNSVAFDKCIIKIFKKSDPTYYALFRLRSFVNYTTYFTMTANTLSSYGPSATPFANGDELLIGFMESVTDSQFFPTAYYVQNGITLPASISSVTNNLTNTAIDNPANGITLLQSTTSSGVNDNFNIMGTSMSSGLYTIPAVNTFWEFGLNVSLSIKTGTGWYSAGSPGSVIAYIRDSNNNIYASGTFTPTAATAFATISINTGVRYIPSGTVLSCRLINASGVTYNQVNSYDAVTFSVKRLA